MKKTILTFILGITSIMVFSQASYSKNVIIGIQTNFGANFPIRFKSADDIFSYQGRLSYTAGVKFSRFISEKAWFDIGVCYTVHKIAMEYYLDPDIDNRMPTETFDVFNVPIVFNRYLNNNFYYSFGTIIDFQFPRTPSFLDKQTGFGLNLGIGKEFSIFNFKLDISPNLEIHSLIPFSPQTNQQRLIVTGIRIGLRNN
jgi:hypothetical protein